LERKTVRSYVVDASVAVKWFVDEDGSDEARLMRDTFLVGQLDLIAPDLLRYEVAIALRYHPVARTNRSSIAGAMQAIEDYQFLVNPSREAWSKAIQLCYESKISPYDAIYIGLANTLKLRLVTADERLIDSLGAEQKKRVKSLTAVAEEFAKEPIYNDSI
jgi:predicted nucleic acid-binding protein